ncbi:MAG: hypothetical protein AMXMBFR58_28880 [Phycisphaerae bacterium]|nr:hypothetical protein [Phycisphaerales bacterium]MCK6475263.1 hypothetical protein [Phycisphaerales bacterium]
MNRAARTRLIGLLCGAAACCVVSGCHSSEKVNCDRLARQTSRPGLIVGDSVGMAMAGRNQKLSQAYMMRDDQVVASAPSDE